MADDLTIEPSQEKLNWCWAAVASTIAGYYFPTMPINQDAVAREVLGPPCSATGSGCDVQADLGEVFDKLNAGHGNPMRKNVLARALTFQEVRDFIDAGVPICVRIEWLGGGGHFVIVTGYSVSDTGVNWVDVSDPFYGDSLLPFDFFSAQYRFVGHWTDSYMMSLV
jgi:Papain-like cysteine protease AvrRpt2